MSESSTITDLRDVMAERRVECPDWCQGNSERHCTGEHYRSVADVYATGDTRERVDGKQPEVGVAAFQFRDDDPRVILTITTSHADVDVYLLPEEAAQLRDRLKEAVRFTGGALDPIVEVFDAGREYQRRIDVREAASAGAR
jgi:hypothetical protein